MAFPTLDTVVKQLREIAEDESITADSKITAIDVDSLDVLEWIFEIEEEAGFVIDEQLYSKASLATATVGDFYERVKKRANGLNAYHSTADPPGPDRIEPVYGLARVIAYPIRPLFHIRRIGSRHVPRRGPVLLACNHISLLDPVIVLWLGECTRRKVRFLAMAELWNTPVLRFFLEHTHQIPVDRASAGALGSLDAAATALGAGECVAVFPEGGISTDLELMPGKSGIARLAATTGVPVTPMGVWGSQRVHAKGRKPRVPWGIALSIVVGPPITVAIDEDVFDATDRIMHAVSECVATARAVYPQQPDDGDDAWWMRSPSSATMRPAKRERDRSRWS